MPTFGNPQLKLLERLCNVIAVSGDEGEVRKIVLEEVRPYADEIKVDALGNVLVTKTGRGRKRTRVMLDAHMDEVGLMIVDEEGEGLYRFELVGGIDLRHLVGKQVFVGRERTPAVIGAKPVHLISGDEYTKKVPLDALRIDVGISGKAKVGDRAGFATQFRRVGPSILAKSIDDRIGVATLIELFKQAPSNIDLCAAFSVQEEIGLRGAKGGGAIFQPGSRHRHRLNSRQRSAAARWQREHKLQHQAWAGSSDLRGRWLYPARPPPRPLFARDSGSRTNPIPDPPAWRRGHRFGRDPAFPGGHPDRIRLRAASLHSYPGQHRPRGRLEAYP